MKNYLSKFYRHEPNLKNIKKIVYGSEPIIAKRSCCILAKWLSKTSKSLQCLIAKLLYNSKYQSLSVFLNRLGENMFIVTPIKDIILVNITLTTKHLFLIILSVCMLVVHTHSCLFYSPIGISQSGMGQT